MSLVAVRPDSTTSGVPWATVLPLAAVMSYADGFWMTSLRGAVGVVGEAQGPFGTWWRESTVVLPVFVLAVLVATSLALRWFGPVVRRLSLAGTALLVALSGSVVGIAELAISSARDYHVQVGQLRAMALMNGRCLSCLHEQQHATLAIHVHAVTYVSRWVVLTNLVLVGWTVALLGGRLRLRAGRSPSLRTGSASAGTRVRDVRVLIAAALVGSAAIHAAVVPEHLAEWPAAGAFFAMLTAGQLVAAIAVVAGPSRAGAAAAAMASVLPLLVWAWSRTVGLPIGPHPGTPEAIGLPDCMSAALETVSLLAALLMLRASGWLRRPRLSPHITAFALVTVMASVSLAITATGAIWPDVLGGSGMAAGH